MKLFTKLFLILVITSFSVIIASAQSPPPTPAKPTKVIGKANIYEFKTKTTAESVFLNRNGKQTIRATFEVPAEQAGEKPKSFQLFHQSVSDNGFKYKDNRKVAIILDDGRVVQSEAKPVMASHSNKLGE